jgi:sugar-phosphatase
LRTEEWIEHWFRYFNISLEFGPEAVDTIIQKAIEKIGQFGQPLPGTQEVISFFKQKDYKIGLATSSPIALADVVLQKLNLLDAFQTISSAGELPYGKPHPLVYLNCANELGCSPVECIAFEDSFNGMIAAKAARMKCVVVPAKEEFHFSKWHAADLKIESLTEFNSEKLAQLERS